MTESHLKALRILKGNPALSQRRIAGELRLSLGKANYVINSLIGKGYVKARRFRNSKNKFSYMYVLTPKGIRKKVQLTKLFIRRKSEEYRALYREIDELKKEIEDFADE